MKKYIVLLIGLFLLTACASKEYTATCKGQISDKSGEPANYTVTVKYDLEDKVKAVEYEILYTDEDTFNNACKDNEKLNPTCENLTVKYTESGELVSGFKKDDVINMLKYVGIDECK